MAADPADLSGITILGTAAHAAWQRRELPPVERIAGGLWSIPVPIPDNPLRYTLSYLVPGDDGVVVVDPGWQSDESWRALTAGLAEAGAEVGDVVGIVATHVHPDHHGLSGRLRELSGAWVAMHPAERDTLPARVEAAAGDTGGRDRMVSGLRASGIPDHEIDALLHRFDEPDTPRTWNMVEPDVLLEDGDAVPLRGRRLHAVWTPGHTPGHLCLREPDARLLLTGDHVLPRITPSIGFEPAPPTLPLADFLSSLRTTASEPDAVLAAAHGPVTDSAHDRVAELLTHHQHRIELTRCLVGAGARTVYEVAVGLRWTRRERHLEELDPFNRMLAVIETKSHLDVLTDDGALDRCTKAGLLHYSSREAA